MATLSPRADWRDPETVRIDQAQPDAVLLAAPLGAHLTWTLDLAQVRTLHQQIGSLLATAEGGGS